MREIVQEWVNKGESDFIEAKTLALQKYDPTFHRLESLVEGITDFAVEFRYPGGNATAKEAQDALDKTAKVRKFLLTKIE